MARLLFWNTYGRDLSADIAHICSERNVDICITCENAASTRNNTLNALNSTCSRTYHCPLNLSSRLEFFAAFPVGSITSLYDSNTIAIRHINHPLGVSLHLIAVHLPSESGYDELDQTLFATRLRQEISHELSKHKPAPIIAIGDFNMDPFHPGLRNSEGFHAVMDKRIAEQRSRVIQGVERTYLYNPMWSYMGDMSSGPPGTYFYRGSTPDEVFWHTYDQVLISPDLVECLDHGGLHVITSHKYGSLANRHSRPDSNNYSDHFPIFCELKLERKTAI